MYISLIISKDNIGQSPSLNIINELWSRTEISPAYSQHFALKSESESESDLCLFKIAIT